MWISTKVEKSTVRFEDPKGIGAKFHELRIDIVYYARHCERSEAICCSDRLLQSFLLHNDAPNEELKIFGAKIYDPDGVELLILLFFL